MEDRIYIAIDLKSFYASVECRERGLDPLDTNLVVADISRTDKTICLAVTPSLKSFGMSGRSRLFEVKQRVREVNIERKQHAPGQILSGTSYFFSELSQNPALAVDFLIAPPQMAHYMECSTRIYSIYMKYVAPEDIVVYSIDEVFMDITDYLPASGMTAREFARKIILDVMDTTGITATAGIGTNLFLCKVAMDIVAKHLPADEYGVRIAFLDEMTFRQKLWAHQPLTDFWRIGHGYARKLAENGLFTMGDIARCSVKNEDLAPATACATPPSRLLARSTRRRRKIWPAFARKPPGQTPILPGRRRHCWKRPGSGCPQSSPPGRGTRGRPGRVSGRWSHCKRPTRSSWKPPSTA